MQPILIIGSGPHSEMCAAVIASTGEWDVVGHVVPSPDEAVPDTITVAGCDADLPALLATVPNAFVGIGDGAVRARLLDLATGLGFATPSIVAPSATLADGVVVGDGAFVAPGAVINTGAVVGRGVIVNTAAVVEHHVHLGDCAHVAPNSTLCGSVTVGALALVGAAAVVLPDLTIGDGAIVAAGSAAARDVAPGTISGLPARGGSL